MTRRTKVSGATSLCGFRSCTTTLSIRAIPTEGSLSAPFPYPAMCTLHIRLVEPLRSAEGRLADGDPDRGSAEMPLDSVGNIPGAAFKGRHAAGGRGQRHHHLRGWPEKTPPGRAR